MAVYGFSREHSRQLKKVARREGLASRGRQTVRYPKPLPDDGVPIRVGKPDQDIAQGAADTVSLYNADTEVDTGDDVEAKALFADVTQDKWVSLLRIDGVWLVFPGEC